jgi:hypothetical protein
MKKLLLLLLCLSLGLFTVARATKSVHTPAAGTLLNDAHKALAAEISSEESYAEGESLDMSDAEQEEVAAEADPDEETASADNEGMEDASDDEAEDVSDDDGGADDPSDEHIGDHDGGNDDFSDDRGDDDSGGDEGD